MSTTTLVPGPEGEQFDAMEPDMFGYLTYLATYGDAVRITMAGVPTIVVFDVELAHRVFADKLEHVALPPPFRRLATVTGTGILTNDNWDTWHPRRRKIIQPLGARAVHRFHERMTRIISSELDAWPVETEFELYDKVQDLTLRVVADLLFSENLTDDALKVIENATAEIHRWAEADPANQNLTDLPATYVTAIEALDEFIRSIIASRDPADPGTDMVGLLVVASQDGQTPLDNESIRDECVTLILAGHETVSATTAFALDLLGRHPELHDSDARHFINETLRLYPPVHITSKLVVRDLDLGPFAVPANTEVWVPEYVIARDERHFERSREFIPDRWAPDSSLRMNRRAYFPFLTGPKFCVGSHFALLEATEILDRFRARYRHEMLDPDMPWGREYALTFTPAKPQPCVLHRL